MFSLDNIKDFNTIDEVESYRKSVNEACDNRRDYIKSCLKAAELSGKSFGFLKECFESMSDKLYKSKAGKKLIRQYVSTIKNDKNLSNLYSIYENIRKMDSTSDVDYFINSINDVLPVNSTILENTRKKIGDIVCEAYVVLGESADDSIPVENKNLDSAIEFIAENKKSVNNLAEYSQAVKIIRESISKNHNGDNRFLKNESIDNTTKMISDFNQKYSKDLAKEDVDMIKKLAESTDSESVFQEYKEKCLNRLSEAKSKCNSDEIEQMEQIITKVADKQFCNETINSDICNLIEITNLF